MCLYTNTGEILTAKADMKVWKAICIDNQSMYQLFKYEPYKLYRLGKALYPYRNPYSRKHASYIVDQGFHSCINKIAAECYMRWDMCKIVEFTIPRGAKYCLGDNGDVVSTSIRAGSLDAISMQHS